MEVHFIFKSSSGRPRVHSKRLPVVVGRADEGDVKLRIPKEAISRRHCEFLLDDAGMVYVRDLDSTNGTYLEGRRLEPRVAVPVASGSVVKLGNVGFRVEYAAAAAARRHDSDTMPIAAKDDSPAESSEPAVSETTPAVEALPLAEPAAAEQPAADDFGFLAETAPAAADADAVWPVGDQPSVTDDKNLEDFFKGLS